MLRNRGGVYWKRIYTALKIRKSKLENIYLALSDNLKQKINLNKIVMSINVVSAAEKLEAVELLKVSTSEETSG